MKDKFLYFIIGLLVGAIIATAAFVVYEKVNKNNNNNQMPNFEQMQMRGRPDGMELPEMQEGTEQDETKKDKQLKDKTSTDSKNKTDENSTV